jgi:putative flippase GtrA
MSVHSNAPAHSPSAAPVRKVAAGGIAGAITVLLVWIASAAFRINIPPEVASAITVIVAFIVSYLVPPAARDVVVSPAPAQVATGASR